MNVKPLIPLCGLALFLGGCSNSENKPTPENFTKTINAWYQDRPDCLFPGGRHFPYEVAPGKDAKQSKAQMDSLMDAGLLKRLEDRDLHVDSYSLIPAGERAAPKFCYGHREVTSIVNSTPPGPHNGFTETTVTYHDQMLDVPVWAKTPQVMAAFPDLAKDLSDSPTDQITLATVGAGWQVPH
jgi:hypothetical protein